MIVIIQYNAGNVRSVCNALARLGTNAVLTRDPKLILSADKVIFPGVGAAGSAMQDLRSHGLDQVIKQVTQPFLGICLGLQLMCAHSEEGDVACLGIFPEQVRAFPPTGKIPHIGWNNFTRVDGPLFKGLQDTDNVYYVHSFYAQPGKCTIATCQYLVPFSAAIQKDNFFGVQFHPEKSAAQGARVLQNFLDL